MNRKNKSDGATSTETAPTAKPRTVKISDANHLGFSVISAARRVPMQTLLDEVLARELKKKTYQKYLTTA